MKSRRSTKKMSRTSGFGHTRKPLPEQTAEVIITDLSHEGRGVARVNNKTVFVTGALPGEQVEIRITSQRSKYDEAVVSQILAASPDRVEPPCPHFAQCGGCQLQHLSVAAQQAHKQQLLLKSLNRIGSVALETVQPVIAAEPLGYRRRARLGVRYLSKEDRIELGFRAAGSDRVTPLKQCPILMAPFAGLFNELAELLNQLSAKRRIPQLEVMVAEDVSAINIHLLSKLQESDREELLAFANRHELALYTQSGDSSTIQPLTEPTVELRYQLPEFKVELQFQPGSFLQVNPAVNQQLVEYAVEQLQLTGEEMVLDLFCGLGNFTLPIARRAKAVVGVEGNTSAIALAQKNADANGLANVQFVVADLTQNQQRSAWGKQKYDAVLLDPPRSGAADILPLIARSGASRVVYVSCHPGTLARDVGVLVNEFDFAIESATPVEMFPHTAHLESVVVLTRGRRD